MINFNRLLDEPYFVYEEFVNKYKQKADKSFLFDIQSNKENYCFAFFLTSLYEEKVNVRSVKINEGELSCEETYSMICEHFSGIESFLFLWIVNHIEPKNNQSSFMSNREEFLRLPLFEKIERTKGLVSQSYLSDRNIDHLITTYHRIKKIKNPFSAIGFYD